MIRLNKHAMNFLTSILCAFSLAFCINSFRLIKQTNGDDALFSGILEGGKSLVSVLISRYETWSARIPIEAIMISSINHMSFVRVFNSLLMILLVFSSVIFINNIIKRKTEYIDYILCFFLLMTFQGDILNDAVFWVTGSFNYLMPVAFLSYLLTYKHSKENIFLKLTYIISLSIASYSEQLIPVILCYFIYIIASNENNKRTKFNYVLLIVFLANAFIFICSPSNEIRYVAEVRRGFNDFYSKDIFDKICLGIYMIASYFSRVGNYTIFLLSLAISISLSLKRKTLPIILSILIVIAALILNSGVIEPKEISPETVFDTKNYILLISCLMFVCLIAVSLSIINIGKKSIVIPFVFMLSVALIAILGFSPTSYTDRPRTLFITSYLIMLCTMHTANNLKDCSVKYILSFVSIPLFIYSI